MHAGVAFLGARSNDSESEYVLPTTIPTLGLPGAVATIDDAVCDDWTISMD